MPYAVGSTPVRNCHNGALSPLSPSSDGIGAAGGTNGFKLDALTKKRPRAITKMHTGTLITTTRIGDPLGLTDSTHRNEPEDGDDQNRSKMTAGSSPKNDVNGTTTIVSWR
jgi:hypothetical protein